MSTRTSRIGIGRDHPRYKWVALSNTTLGSLLATINLSIVLISLPAIFRGIKVNPLAPGEIDYLLWVLLSYMVVTAVLVVTAGRISDMLGRVRMYNLGFAIFTVGSILLFLTPGSGNQAALEMIVFRVVQAVGGAFLFANAPAILTDAFPVEQRGLALGLNMIAGTAGQLLGLVLGGVLAAIDWHLVFLVSVPVGVLGTVWAFVALHETTVTRRGQRVDVIGNLLFASGLVVFLVGITYGLLPYGSSSMGWLNPWVDAGLLGGPVLIAVFVMYEQRVKDPMLDMSLFRIRAFAAGNAATLFGAIARGGLQFMLIIWLQGIWLPTHGYSYQDTPLWSGIYMIPLLAGFILLGPLFGLLSDRFGQRPFAAGAMLITALGFVLLALLPADFSYPEFAAVLVVMGLGMGGFLSPNTAWIMNAVPAGARGVASGTRATFQNSGMLLSMGIFFTMVILGLAGNLPAALGHGLTAAGLPAAQACPDRPRATHVGALRRLPRLQPDPDAGAGRGAAQPLRRCSGNPPRSQLLPQPGEPRLHHRLADRVCDRRGAQPAGRGGVAGAVGVEGGASGRRGCARGRGASRARGGPGRGRTRRGPVTGRQAGRRSRRGAAVPLALRGRPAPQRVGAAPKSAARREAGRASSTRVATGRTKRSRRGSRAVDQPGAALALCAAVASAPSGPQTASYVTAAATMINPAWSARATQYAHARRPTHTLTTTQMAIPAPTRRTQRSKGPPEMCQSARGELPTPETSAPARSPRPIGTT